MNKFFKRLRYFLFLRARNKLEKVPWKMLNLNLTTLTGICLFIRNRPDWQVYNEIFVRGDYDFAINKSLEKKSEGSDFMFMDLGANVGFFTMRVADRILQDNNTINVSGIAVEGSMKVYEEMGKRLSKNPNLKNKIRLIHGLAGKKSGFAKIYESSNSLTNSIVATSSVRKAIAGVKVPYIDVSELYNLTDRIDLLKCDIEGSEEEFMETYPDILKKTQVLVVELHHRRCDTVKCMQLIEMAGLQESKTIFDYGQDVSLKVYWRY